MSKHTLAKVSDGTTVYVEYDASNKPYLHLEFKGEWSIKLYREYAQHFNNITQYLKEQGHSHVYVIIPKDEKLLRFEQLFGFEISSETDNMYYLQQEL